MSQRVSLLWGDQRLDLTRRRLIFGHASGDPARDFLPEELFSLVTGIDGQLVLTPLCTGWPDICVNSVPIEEPVRLTSADVVSWGPGPRPESEHWFTARVVGLEDDLVPLGCMGVDGRPVSVQDAEPQAVLLEAFDLVRPHAVFELAERWHQRTIRLAGEWWLARNVAEAGPLLRDPSPETLHALAQRVLAEAANDSRLLERADATAALLQVEVSNETTTVGLEAAVSSRDRAMGQLQQVLEATRAILSVLDPQLAQKEALAQLADVLVKGDQESERADALGERITEHAGDGVLDGDVIISDQAGRIARSDLRVVRGKLVIEHCPNLVHITLPNLEAAQEIHVRHNPWLTRLSAPRLELVVDAFDISNNELLRSIELPALEDVGELSIEHNFSLDEHEVERLKANPVVRWSRISPGINPDEPLQTLIAQARLDPEFRASLITTLSGELSDELEWTQLVMFDALARDDARATALAARQLGRLSHEGTRRVMEAFADALDESGGRSFEPLELPAEDASVARVREAEERLSTVGPVERVGVAEQLLGRLFGDYLPRLLEREGRRCLAHLFMRTTKLSADVELMLLRYADAAKHPKKVRALAGCIKEPVVALSRSVMDAARSVHERLATRELTLLERDIAEAVPGKVPTVGPLARSWQTYRDAAAQQEETTASEAIAAVLAGLDAAAQRIASTQGSVALESMRQALRASCVRRRWDALSSSQLCEVGPVMWVDVAVHALNVVRHEHFGWRDARAERLEQPLQSLTRGLDLTPEEIATIYARLRAVAVPIDQRELTTWADRVGLYGAVQLWQAPFRTRDGVHWFSCEASGLIAHTLDPELNHSRRVALELARRSLFS